MCIHYNIIYQQYTVAQSSIRKYVSNQKSIDRQSFFPFFYFTKLCSIYLNPYILIYIYNSSVNHCVFFRKMARFLGSQFFSDTKSLERQAFVSREYELPIFINNSDSDNILSSYFNIICYHSL